MTIKAGGLPSETLLGFHIDALDEIYRGFDIFYDGLPEKVSNRLLPARAYISGLADASKLYPLIFIIFEKRDKVGPHDFEPYVKHILNLLGNYTLFETISPRLPDEVRKPIKNVVDKKREFDNLANIASILSFIGIPLMSYLITPFNEKYSGPRFGYCCMGGVVGIVTCALIIWASEELQKNFVISEMVQKTPKIAETILYVFQKLRPHIETYVSAISSIENPREGLRKDCDVLLNHSVSNNPYVFIGRLKDELNTIIDGNDRYPFFRQVFEVYERSTGKKLEIPHIECIPQEVGYVSPEILNALAILAGRKDDPMVKEHIAQLRSYKYQHYVELIGYVNPRTFGKLKGFCPDTIGEGLSMMASGILSFLPTKGEEIVRDYETLVNYLSAT